MKTKFSFIIPTLNEGKYIEECLKSIAKQGRTDYEIIVVDSYSKDDTVRIAKKYKAVVLYEGRKGPGIARNTGAKKAKGSILVFADADVRFRPDFLERIDWKFRKDIGGGICKLVPYDAENVLLFNSYRVVNKIAKFFIRIGASMTAGSCFIYTKYVFDKAGGFDPTLLTNEDHEMAGRASKIKRFAFFDDIVVGTSSRRIKNKGLLSMTKVYFKSSVAYFLNRSYVRDYWQ